MKRVFIVGTARSGTTLLQSLIGSHKDIFSFPESHFFSKTIPKRKILQWVYKPSDQDKNYIKDFLTDLGQEQYFQPFTSTSYGTKDWVKYLIDTIDRLAESQGKTIWLEKTPLHLHYLDIIKECIPDAYFIHTVREPMANISSLYHISNKHPDNFAQKKLSAAYKRYVKEVKLTEKYIDTPQHDLVYYEDLVLKTEAILQKICKRIGVEYSSNLLEYSGMVDRIAKQSESWKARNKEPLAILNLIRDRLSKEEFLWLEKKVLKLNYPILEHYETITNQSS
ncbi:sulfotransferase [bacterium]|nr:sulfotransferase [bacterium]